jgi:3',5'-cyclic AMP phosphodiesterase CpdA
MTPPPALDPNKLPVYRWLHLSDIHIGCEGRAEWWQTLEDFKKSLKIWLPKVGGVPDMILLTGDLTNRGAADEYEKFTGFLDGVQKALAEHGAQPLVIAVPGNHEVQRASGEQAYPYAIIDSYESRASHKAANTLHNQLWTKK